MPQGCSVCAHADRAAIEQQHIEGVSLRGIAKLHLGVTPWSLRRHFQHLPAIIEKVQGHQLAQNQASAKLPARVEELIAEAKAITATARRKGDHAGALAAIRTRLSCLEALGRLSGELRPGGPLAGEFVPGTGAAAMAQVQVTVEGRVSNKEPRDPSALADRMRQIYHLLPRPTEPIN
jgi:hypothetical protein